MNAVSLFAGVGGFDLALERSGIKVVATCEIDKNAQKILARHFPDAELFSDVTTLTRKELLDVGFEPSTGIIVGGFPCQDVSVAGKRAGLTLTDGTHTRSGLFWQVVRLLKETKAQHFILENVPGLLSSNKGRDFGTVLGALDELGYGVSWRILDAQYFGVPQRRRRVFIVGCLGDPERASEILAIAEGRRGYLEASQQTGQKTSRKVGASSQNGEWWNGGAVADSVTTTSNEQRMPDKGRLQAVVVPLAFDEFNNSLAETHHTLRSGTKQSNGVLIPFAPSSFAQYKEEITGITATLRAGGGDLGGNSETLLIDGTRVGDVRVTDDGIEPNG